MSNNLSKIRAEEALTQARRSAVNVSGCPGITLKAPRHAAAPKNGINFVLPGLIYY